MYTEQEQEYIAGILLAMAENFSADLSSQGVQLYIHCLQDYNFEDVKKALFHILSTRKYLKMPTIAEILEALHGNPEEDAIIESNKVWKAISQHGAYKSVCFDNKITQAVIDTFGGWVRLCYLYNVSQQHFFKKDFCETYKIFHKKNIKKSGYFLGVAESHNGEQENEKIIKIGDEPMCEENIINSNGLRMIDVE